MVLEFQYLNPEKSMTWRGDVGIRFLVGERSHRIYAIDVPRKLLEGNSVAILDQKGAFEELEDAAPERRMHYEAAFNAFRHFFERQRGGRMRLAEVIG